MGECSDRCGCGTAVRCGPLKVGVGDLLTRTPHGLRNIWLTPRQLRPPAGLPVNQIHMQLVPITLDGLDARLLDDASRALDLALDEFGKGGGVFGDGLCPERGEAVDHLWLLRGSLHGGV